MTKTNKMRLIAGVSAVTLINAAAVAAHAADAAAADNASVEEVIVTGTRQTGMKAADSAAPIQVLGSGTGVAIRSSSPRL